MNDIYIGDNNNLLKPMVDFNYKMRDSKSSRRSMFDILSPKKNPKTINKNNNPKEEDEYVEQIEYEVIKSLLPDSVIMINNYTEESLKNKLMLNPEYEEK